MIRNPPSPFSTVTGLAYALPLIPVLLLMNSLNMVQGIYAKHYGLSLTSISAVMFFAGLFDAITDPAIGYWSDHHHTRTGSRRAFIVFGALLTIPCAWFLFVPDGEVSLVYFIFWYMAFYLAFTLFMIPHLALGGELSDNSSERTRIYGLRTLGSYIGLILYYLIPLLPFFATREITPETMRYSVMGSGILILPCLYLFIRNVPTAASIHDITHVSESPIKVLRSLITNKPLLLFLGTSIFFGLGVGVFYGLLFIVTDTWLELGDHYAFLLLFHLAVATILIKPAVWLTNRLGKQTTWAIGIALSICCLPIALLLLQKSQYSLVLLYLLQFLLGSASVMGNVSQPSLLTDIIDYETLKSGCDRSAGIFSMQSFLGKVSTTTLGYPLGGAILGYYGFDPANPMRTEQILFGFKLAMGWIPALISLIALGLVFLIPINSRRRAIIRKRLDSRKWSVKAGKKPCLHDETHSIKPRIIYDNH